MTADLGRQIARQIAALSPAELDLLQERLRQNGVLPPTQASSADAVGAAIPRRQTSDPVPLSLSQQGFWFRHELEPEMPINNNGRALRLSGRLDVDALRRAFLYLIERQEILRTVYRVDENGQPTQVLLAAPAFDLPVIDLSGIADAEAVLPQQIETFVRQPFDLAHDLPLRAVVYKLDENDYAFCEVHHHIATDFWSAGILRRELSALYRDHAAGWEPSLPPLPVQYADFAAWQRRQQGMESFEHHLDYWRERLRGPLPTLALAHDYKRPPTPTYRGSSDSLQVAGELWAALQTLGRRHGATPFMVMAAAIVALFHRYSGQDDLLLGAVVSGRNRPELEGVIGAFISSVVLRLDTSGDPAFVELLGRVRQEALAAYAHQDVPFERVVAEVRPERSINSHPIVQVMLDFVNSPGSEFTFADLRAEPIPFERGTSEYDLLIAFLPALKGVTITITYSLDLFAKRTITGMLVHLHTLLQGIVASSQRRLSELPLLGAEERRQVLSAWGDGGPAPATMPALYLHELFERQASLTPETVAVEDGASQLSYGALNQRANNLAQRLQALGVESETVVGLFADRSCHTIVGLLGILKAGGAFVPLDPEAPAERLAFMLEDAGANIVLVDGANSLPFAKTPVTLLRLEELTGLSDAEAEANPASGVKAENLAYILYTSGSTGRPKGVQVEHRQLRNYVFAAVERLGLIAGGSFAMVQPLTVDSCHTMIFPALCFGGTLHLVDRERSLSPGSAGNDHADACHRLPENRTQPPGCVAGGAALARPAARRVSDRGGRDLALGFHRTSVGVGAKMRYLESLWSYRGHGGGAGAAAEGGGQPA